MRIPPQKPHFFQPVQRHFMNGIMIPESFFKYLRGVKKCKEAVLRRGRKKWKVKINGRSIEGKGWKKFAHDIGLHVGDSVMFRHEGNFVFKVLVFDKSRCEKDYVFLENPSARKRKSYRSNQISRGKKSMKVTGEASSECAFPYFDSSLKTYNFSRSLMCIPMGFARANGLYGRKCRMFLIDPNYKEWPVQLQSANHVYIGAGWKELCVANELKQGDNVRFELIDQGETPIMKISEKVGNQSEPPRSRSTLCDKSRGGDLEFKVTDSTSPVRSNAGDEAASEDDHPYFEFRVMPGAFPYLTIPLDFARSNGLDRRRCKVILVGSSEGLSWSMELDGNATHVIIRKNWKRFLNDNGFVEGDKLRVELVEAGDKPIMKVGKYPLAGRFESCDPLAVDVNRC